MRVLVTGGCGFIGSNFIHTLFHCRGNALSPDLKDYNIVPKKDNLEVLNLDILSYAADSNNLDGVDQLEGYSFVQTDVADRRAVEEAAGQFKPDIVVHFAAESHVDRSIESGDIFVRTNIMGTHVMLDFTNKHNVKRFIHISTDEVYGSTEEGSFLETDRLYTTNPYSASKGGSDLMAMAHHATYGTPVVITRCTNNYGPGQHREKLIPKIIHLAKRGLPIPIYGDGTNVRDWIYVKDHCIAILEVIEKGVPGSIYNIAGGNECSNIEVVNSVLSSLGMSDMQCEFISDRPGHDWRYSIDDSKLRSLGWSPVMDFEEGLRHTVEWYSGH